MHVCSNNLLTLCQKDRTRFPFLSRYTAETRPDINIKVAAFTVSQKSYNISLGLRKGQCITVDAYV